MAAGVLYDARGRVLLGQRTASDRYLGQWEFPGGKLDPGESPVAALTRELREELGVEVLATTPLITLSHDYPDRRVRLHVYEVTDYAGEPHGREGQPLRWRSPAELDGVALLDANRPIVRALTLPRFYLITDTRRYGLAHTVARLRDRLAHHACLVQLRENTLPDGDLRRAAAEVLAVCHPAGARVLGNMTAERARELGLDGVHLNRHALMAAAHRPLPDGHLVAASCHDATELAHAQRIGADLAVLSQVAPTDSHPGATPLGWERFGALCDRANLPVYALGGVGWADLARARAAGAQGVAMIGAAWGEPASGMQTARRGIET